MAKRALVLSGGGMFGAWQAGAWRAVSRVFDPELIVGASVGSLNGYAIAAGWTPDELAELWRSHERAGFGHLRQTAESLVAARPLQREYAAVLVDLLRMKPETFVAPSIDWRHLVASCAVPLAVPPQRLDGRWYLDGGLLNPLPVWAAVELGATEIIGLNVLAQFPSVWLRPFVRGFRGVFGHNPKLPPGVSLKTLAPGATLGTLRDAVGWKRENIERWLKQGEHDALLQMRD